MKTLIKITALLLTSITFAQGGYSKFNKIKHVDVPLINNSSKQVIVRNEISGALEYVNKDSLTSSPDLQAIMAKGSTATNITTDVVIQGDGENIKGQLSIDENGINVEGQGGDVNITGGGGSVTISGGGNGIQFTGNVPTITEDIGAVFVQDNITNKLSKYPFSLLSPTLPTVINTGGIGGISSEIDITGLSANNLNGRIQLNETGVSLSGNAGSVTLNGNSGGINLNGDAGINYYTGFGSFNALQQSEFNVSIYNASFPSDYIHVVWADDFEFRMQTSRDMFLQGSERADIFGGESHIELEDDMLFISSGIINATSNTIAKIDADATGKAVVTKEYLNNKASYSTTETKTGGTWLNGKPIYTKMLIGTLTGTGSAGGFGSIPTDAINVRVITSEYIIGTDYSADTRKGFPMHRISGSGINTITTEKVEYQSSNTDIQIEAFSNVINLSTGVEDTTALEISYEMQIEYTKTTD